MRYLLLISLALSTACGAANSYPNDLADTVCEIRAKVYHGEPSTDARSTVLVKTETGMCTGTYIAPAVVLTAAHCTNPPTVYYSGKEYQVVHTEIHPEYDRGRLYADLQLLWLDDTLPAQPISIGLPEVGTALIQGYGETETGEYTGLNEASITVAGFKNGKLYTEYKDTPGPDACFGDSGGPVYQNGKLVGVTSHGLANTPDPCGYGGAYTIPSLFADWVLDLVSMAVETC